MNRGDTRLSHREVLTTRNGKDKVRCGHVLPIRTKKILFAFIFNFNRPDVQLPWPGRVAQSVGHLTRKSEVLGSIPAMATYFRFSLR